jgi:hypothetical protein
MTAPWPTTIARTALIPITWRTGKLRRHLDDAQQPPKKATTSAAPDLNPTVLKPPKGNSYALEEKLRTIALKDAIATVIGERFIAHAGKVLNLAL